MIKDHQDLLNRFYEADCQSIRDRSSNITEDTEKLNEEVKEYAQRHLLQSPVKGGE